MMIPLGKIYTFVLDLSLLKPLLQQNTLTYIYGNNIWHTMTLTIHLYLSKCLRTHITIVKLCIKTLLEFNSVYKNPWRSLVIGFMNPNCKNEKKTQSALTFFFFLYQVRRLLIQQVYLPNLTNTLMTLAVR